MEPSIDRDLYYLFLYSLCTHHDNNFGGLRSGESAGVFYLRGSQNYREVLENQVVVRLKCFVTVSSSV